MTSVPIGTYVRPAVPLSGYTTLRLGGPAARLIEPARAQNVGAYGVEVSQLLISVALLDRASGEIRALPADRLGLAYRTSILKNTDRAVVLRVRFELTDDALSAPIRYTELARALGVRQGT